ncbi:MAG TPA: hypothetical protein VGX45_04950 [Solirubrobacteraceae bacterium]|jgi:hypothetical protein|nr:hypothetical protein [Solirubrobacteraceae bacterium]
MTAFDDALWTRLVDRHGADRVALGSGEERRRRRPLLVGVSGAAALGAAGAAVAVLSVTGGASDAFAGWTPQPTTPTPAQLAATEAYCATNEGFPALPLKLVDARGPFTIIVNSDGTSNDFCTVGPTFRNASGWRTSAPLTVPSGRMFLWTDHVATANGQPYGTMIARLADDVTAANITLDDGTEVTATVQNGWALAWWPGAHHVASAQLATPSGTQTQTFNYPCDVHDCTGGPHGGAPGGGPGGG